LGRFHEFQAFFLAIEPHIRRINYALSCWGPLDTRRRLETGDGGSAGAESVSLILLRNLGVVNYHRTNGGFFVGSSVGLSVGPYVGFRVGRFVSS